MERPSLTVITDGGVDLPEWAPAALNIKVVPLKVRFGEQELSSGVDITPGEFYRRLRQGGEFPQTSQPSVGDFLAAYQEAAELGLPILSIHLSGAMSGSIRSAQTAADLLPGVAIRVVDTGTLSGAMAMQVMVAADMALQGFSVEEILAQMQEVGRKSDTLFTIDKLDYLRRGGRIGKVAGYVGSLLGIRPIITVEKPGGVYTATGRARSYQGAVAQIVETMVDRLGEGAEVSVIIMQGDAQAEVDWMINALHQRLNPLWIEVVHANPSLGAHVGPDALGVAYYPGMLPLRALYLSAVGQSGSLWRTSRTS